MEWPTRVPPVLIRWGGLALAIIAVVLWLRYAPPEASWSPKRILGAVMPPPKVLREYQTITVPGPERIKVIKKEVLVEKFRDLPTPATVADNNAVVTAAADIPPSPEGGTAISVLRTGQDNVAVGSIEFQPKPSPFFKIKREMAIRGGFGTEGILAELVVRPLRVGPVEVEGRVYGRSGSGNSNSEVGAAVMLEYRF